MREYDSSNPYQSGFIARNKDAIWQLVTTAKALSFEDVNNDHSLKETAKREKQWSLYQEQIKNDALTIELLKDELQKSVELVDKRYKDIAQKGEFLAQEDIFRNEAKKQQSKANWWLFGIVLAVLIIIAILAFIIDDFCFSTDCFKDDKLVGYEVFCQGCGEQVLWYKLVKAIIFRVFLLSMSVYLLLFTIKNYNAHMHIKAVNSHKENSFAAAIHLIGRTDTPEGKDKLIVQAATSIFSHQNTGHIGKDSEPNNPIFIDKVIDKLK